ncbi:MAG: bifunctional diaminohydroxyphosphoribosylaminopyrimidine deaminase/5-amino-6-(5-phosphoribosylamino)uracil reductase RibD [Paramuribaculum sp.]|nr:bifunctional diaminohydroxyphosphoribosylaminopyrimidine deaminase/5-amino-6-(5-phosphoribosylamino)uracil reductase RibD [Paramuribaculum sp.]
MEIDSRYMARAIQLARNGLGYASPNPMVGAVIVHDGQIIGEGWHRRCGQAHAEVNAVASVRNPELLKHSTIYVTLEPCSHYGKTPPCAQLLIDKQIPRVVIGSLDPFEKVSGRGVAMLRQAGVEVVCGVMEQECRMLNKRFMYAHTHRMPYVTLKWACSSDGYMDSDRTENTEPVKFSSPLGATLVHLMRSRHDAIMVGSGTVLADDCRLDVRLVDGQSPRRVVMDRRNRVPQNAAVMQGQGCLHINHECTLEQLLHELYEQGITSLMVEGGATLLREFVRTHLWCEARIEQSPLKLAPHGAAHMPIPSGEIKSIEHIGSNILVTLIPNN